ncbi:general transcriptional corepressor trfA isoform X2 [Phlebotomus argentipes]|uniref:general transcriptional corepressor trfA isoform X2 n=1 Tax=Phlebotomus argentipes TaxID=94469 RepID=UPI002892C771|nr:general transcriptional corepressor trfA isoform X2 [Phlebotomus argentipes]
MQEDQIIEVEVVSIDPDFDFGSPGRDEEDPSVEVMSILAQVNESIQEENARIEQSLVESANSPVKRLHKKSFSLPASPTFDVPEDMNLSISLDDINVDEDADTSLNDKADDFNLLEWIQADEKKRTGSAKRVKQSRGKDLNLVRAEMEKQSKREAKRTVRKAVTRQKKRPETDSEDIVDVVTVSPIAKHRVQSDPTWCPTRNVAKATPKPAVEKTKPNRGKNDLSSMKMKFLAANPIPVGFKKRKEAHHPIRRQKETVDHDYCSPRRRQVPAVPKMKKEEKCHRNVLDILKEKGSQGAVDRSWRMGNGDVMTFVDKEEVVVTENTPKSGQSLLKPLNERIEKPAPKQEVIKTQVNPLRHVRKEHEAKPSAPYRDPILVAKEKALRIRERKRAAALKILDEEVKVKSASLMPILPLAEMTGIRLMEDDGKSPRTETEAPKATHLSSEYEEIVIVSMGCNTEISIPPETESASGLLQQSSLFSNITETIIKSTPISSNSLLFSIQDMMMKKNNPGNASGITSPRCAVSPPDGASPDKPEGANDAARSAGVPVKEHGEDKVIMHLRKDRIRPTTATISVQTVRHMEFSPIGGRKRSLSTESSSSSSTTSSSSSSSSSSSESSDRSSFSYKRRSYRSRSRSHRRRRSYRSSSGSRSRSRSWDRRSRSHERRSRSRDRRMPQRSRNMRKTSPEERRIVYVGKLEQDLTKDDLKRKFLTFGPITKITLHYKEVTRMRYGFVTFERARDAYEAIDSGSKNPELNHYDISFGGRRAFCRASYSDLDNVAPIGFYGSRDFYGFSMDVDAPSLQPARPISYANESFDSLLQSFKRKVNP